MTSSSHRKHLILNIILITVITSTFTIFFICTLYVIWRRRKANKSDTQLPLDSIVPEKRRNSVAITISSDVERARDFRERAKAIKIGRPRFKQSRKRQAQGNTFLYTRALGFRTLNDRDFRLHAHENNLRMTSMESDTDSACCTISDIYETPRQSLLLQQQQQQPTQSAIEMNITNNISDNNHNDNVLNYLNDDSNTIHQNERYRRTSQELFESFPEEP